MEIEGKILRRIVSLTGLIFMKKSINYSMIFTIGDNISVPNRIAIQPIYNLVGLPW